MKTILMFLVITLLLAAGSVLAQHGGKAEAQRIKFVAGKSSATLRGTLSRDEEMEYVFGASKGQKVTIKNTRTSLFDFRVFSEEFNFETEFESSPTLTFTIPETGNYNFFVRKKQVKTPRTARYLLTLSIK